MLIRRAEIPGRGIREVRIDGDRIAAIDTELPRISDEPVLDAGGGALLPGLHDHHIHLLALAAALNSIRCGPPDVDSPEALGRALERAVRNGVSRDGWLRGTGYHESVAGPLDRQRLDALCAGLPLRVQHRSGALWMLNGAALERLGLLGRLRADTPKGVERDALGFATGRIFRLDAWLRARWGSAAPPDLDAVGAMLSRFGVTGVTDTTPGNETSAQKTLAAAIASGALRQRLRLMGSAALPAFDATTSVERGELKLMLADDALPDLDVFTQWIRDAHSQDRCVAVHCVTRAELAFAAAAFEAAGPRPGDRIEHAAVAPPELAELIAKLGLCVVTQPNFIYERGDAYRREVEEIDQPWLYRCQGLLDAGVPLAGGTDAPFGNPDPWLAIRAATNRKTRAGAHIGLAEALAPERALALFTSPADAPGNPPRALVVGAPADLCLLDRPWQQARRDLESEHVRATFARGVLTFDRARGKEGEGRT